ncbi:MAG TPA: hypothetical protein VFB12_13325, partial [Ktedonobacteraceae bacterium]|nr:hypothetical protein [Ktedonobacteraceae bacterium]
MMNQLKAAYTNYTLVKVAAFIGVLLGGALLYNLFGGFPPLAWKLLAQALFHIPTLWAIGGTGILIPLLGLVLLSTALLIIWGILVVLATRIIQHLWHDLHEHQQFAMDLREAEYLAEQNFMDENFAADDAWLLDRAPALGGAPQRSKEGKGLINPARGHGRAPFGGHAPALLDQEERFNSSGLDQESDEAHAPTQYIMRNQPTRPAPRPDLIATMPQMQSYNVPRSRVVGGRIPDPPTPPSGPINRAPADGSRGAYQQAERRVHIPMDNPVQESVRTQSRDLQTASEQQRVQTAPSRVAARPQLRLVPTLEDYLEDDLDHLNAPDSLDNLPISPANSTTLDEPELDIAQRATIPGRDEEDDNDMDITTPTTLPKRNTNYDTMPFTEPLVPEEPLRLVVGIGLDPGIVRKNDPNEDNLFAIQGTRMTKGGPTPVGLFVVADGMGGHANGQEASRLAIHAISDVVVPALLHNMSRLSSPTNRTASEDTLFRDLLKDGVHRANLAIY